MVGCEELGNPSHSFTAITNEILVPDVYVKAACDGVGFDVVKGLMKEEFAEKCVNIGLVPPAISDDIVHVPPVCSEVLARHEESDARDDMLCIDDLQEDLTLDVANVGFDFVPPMEIVAESVGSDETKIVNMRGMRAIPEPELFKVGKGNEKQRSAHNDMWSLRRVDELRSQLGWDMTVHFADLPFKLMDELLANLFSRVTKVNGEQYPAASLTNMMNGFNRMICRGFDMRVLNGIAGEEADKDFNIKRHRAFTKTRLVLNAAIKKGGREGVNKKVKKASEITQPMEDAIFIDLEHQVTDNYGCQKRLAAFIMLRTGARGRKELWLFKRQMIEILTNTQGEEYVQFIDRTSKTQEYTIDRNKEHQFCKPYYSFEPDFVLTVKQYYRHLAPLTNPGVVDDLFTTPIHNHVGVVWYNRKHKVSEDRSGQWLANMLKLVGLPEKLFSNKSVRVSLITRMAAHGVPDDVGMMITGHRTLSGYSRYDRTTDLKQEAATLCGERRDLDYTTALKEVTERRRLEQVQSSVDLKPLVAPEQMKEWGEKLRKGKQEAESSTLCNELQVMPGAQVMSTTSVTNETKSEQGMKMIKAHDLSQLLSRSHRDYDGIDWEIALQNDPILANALGGGNKRKMTIRNVAGNLFLNMQNCTIHINVCQPAKTDEIDKENIAPGNASKQLENVAVPNRIQD